jgi:sterol desaturase/sphingolipid hydroxylase (fatty acid hydroxylase superfamily)
LELLTRAAAAIAGQFPGILWLSALTLALFVVIYVIERAYGQTPERYCSREFLQDLGYWIYYRAGVHNLLLTAWVLQAMRPTFAFLRLDLLDTWPVVARYFAYWIVFDFMAYWVHRWKHASRWLWAFHVVHHSQQRLTFATLTRGHPFEQVFGSVIAFFPLVVLGAPPEAWLPLQLVREFLEAIQHSAIPWRLGWFSRVIVSPVFHSFHHSTDPAHHDRNFGVNLAVWDHLFGTAVDAPSRPSEFGLKNVQMPTVTSQMIGPLQTIVRQWKGEARS